MRYFSPLLWYNGERVDIGYDYDEEKSGYENLRERVANKVCGYNFFNVPLADGILVSRSLLESSTNLTNEDGRYKVKTYKKDHWNILDYARTKGLRYPSFADPGTFSHANKFELPKYLYDTDKMIDYYRDLQYDMAGSVDWPIIEKVRVQEGTGNFKYVELTDEIKEMRRSLTIELAGDFIKKCGRRTDVNFLPFGTIQGYSPNSYRQSMREILELGYKYIAIGGLPSYSEKQVVELLPIFSEEIKRAGYRPGVHLYGRFPSPRYVGFYLENFVTSFDNNSPFLAASRTACNYYHPDFVTNNEQVPVYDCCSIRIPAERGPLLHRLKRKDLDLWATGMDKAGNAFAKFVAVKNDPSDANIDKFLDTYDDMNLFLQEARMNKVNKNRLKKDRGTAARALRGRLWLKCKCDSCKMIGAHIMLTRGQRIPHTFLHNTYVQYARFKRELKTALMGVDYPAYDWNEVDSYNDFKTIKRRKVI
jgi:hypothetical protein